MLPAPTPLRIVLAEDNCLLSDVLSHLLRRAGHEVWPVADGLAAWDRLGKDIRQYDVVITDHDMPHLTGLELVDRLRQADYRGRIVVHSSALTGDERRSYEAFRVRIVAKAARADELMAAVAGEPVEIEPC